jgi:hypothetical protein
VKPSTPAFDAEYAVRALRRGRPVHQDVEPAPPRRGGIDHALGVLLDGDVAQLRQRRAASAGDLLDQRVDPAPAVVGDADDLLAAVQHSGGLLVGHHDGDAGGGERERDRAPHAVPLTAPGDQRDAGAQCAVSSDPTLPE